MSDETEIKISVEKIGSRVSQTGEAKRFTYVESVDAEGTIHKTFETEKSVFDCGHFGDAGTGAVCQVCGSFVICDACVRTENFVCHACHRIACPRCRRESLFHPGVAICRRCGFAGMIRAAIRKRR